MRLQALRAISNKFSQNSQRLQEERLQKNLTSDQRAIAVAMIERNEPEAVKRIRETKDDLIFRLFEFSESTPLQHAADHGLTEVIRALLDRGVAADSTLDADPSHGRAGSTALLLTLVGSLDDGLPSWREGRFSAVQLLLRAGANPNARDLDGWSPLSMSLRWFPTNPGPSSLQVRAVEALLAAGADVNARARLDPIAHGKAVQMSLEPRATALSDAIHDHKSALATLLRQHGADPKAQDSVALAAAVDVGDKDMVDLLLSRGASPNARAYMGHDPLLAGRFWQNAGGGQSREPYRSIVLSLLAAGADPNTRITDREGSVPILANAELVGNQDLVSALVSKGVDPNTKALDPGGRPSTMLEWILRQPNSRFTPAHPRSVAVSSLLSAGVKPNMHDGPEVPLALTRDEEPDVIAVLLDNGARLEPVVLPGGERIGPISNQIRSGRTVLPAEVVRRTKGPLDREDKLALLLAAEYRNVDVLQALLEHKVDPGVRGPHGETALHFAAMTGQVRAIELLLAAGADPNARTGLAPEPASAIRHATPNMDLMPMFDGRLTPLMLAAAAGHREAVQLLLRKGARPTLKSEYGTTAVEFVDSFHQEISEDLAAASKSR